MIHKCIFIYFLFPVASSSHCFVPVCSTLCFFFSQSGNLVVLLNLFFVFCLFVNSSFSIFSPYLSEPR